MDYVIVGSAVVLIGTFIIIGLLAIRSRMVFRIAVRNFLKRKRSTLFAIFGLAVGAAIVTGSLVVGDSLEYAVVQSTFQNLGDVDEAVRSAGVFNESIVDEIKTELLDDEIDAVAPLMILPVSVKNNNSGARQSLVNIIAFTDEFLDFGYLKLSDGSTFEGSLGYGQALINRKLAESLRASDTDVLNVSFRTPEFSFETVYSQITSLQYSYFEVLDVVEDTGLGRFQLGSSGVVPENMYVRLDALQQALDLDGRVNTVIVSNTGDEVEGVESSLRVTQLLEGVLDEHIGYEDVGFSVTASDYVKIDRKEIFFGESFLDIVLNITSDSALVEEVSQLTSYFFNLVTNGTSFVAYSVSTGFDPVVDSAFGLFERRSNSEQIVGEIADNEAIVNEYVADMLGIGEGATIALNYSIYDETFTEVYQYEDFTVKYVINLTGKAHDSELMPPFPGIKGKDSCLHWDPPIPIDVQNVMEDEGLGYWIAYGGSPKIYITLDKAKELWANDLGDITTIKILPTSGTNATVLAQVIGTELNQSIGHRDAGITVSPVKKEGIDSAEGVAIVTETYIAFGSVVILAGMVLIVLFVATSAEERRREIGIVRTLGATRKKTTLAFVFEGSFFSIIAAVVGALLGVLVAVFSVWMTNTYWSNLVEGNEISLYLTLPTILLGVMSGFLISLITYAVASYAISKMSIVDALRRISVRVTRRSRGIGSLLLAVLGLLMILMGFMFQDDPSFVGMLWLFGPVFLMMGIGFFTKSRFDTKLGTGIMGIASIAYTLGFDIVFLTTYEDPGFILFFLSGFIVVFSAAVAFWSGLSKISELLSRSSVTKVAFSNPTRKPAQSTMTIAMFGLVIFTLVALAVNISGQQANIDRAVEEQSAGYQVLAEATTPVRFDMGEELVSSAGNTTQFLAEVKTVQFSTYGSPGGTCSNLNSNLPPRLIGANETFLQDNTFVFSSSLDHDPSDAQGAWSELDEVQADGSIPIVGDTNTIIWIYGKGVGDTITIADENGQDKELLVVGILRSSMFSGSVFLSEENIDDLFPTKAEFSMFLFKTDEPEQLATYLEENMDTYGMDATLVEERVREDLEVEWSYMSLFQTLLLFGLVVGTAGLALTSAKSVSERRNEIGILRSLGFKRSMVLQAFLLENLYISLSGTVLGVVFGLLVSFIFFGPVGGQDYGVVIPWLTIIVIIIIVLVSTLLSTAGPSLRAGRMRTVDALKVEE
jgi:ABC-type antimicrobial peptide transport system permease subunit